MTNDRHPMFFQADLMTEEVFRLYWARNAPALRQRAIEILQQVTEDNFDQVMPQLHITFGLYDAIVDGRAVTVVTDATNC